MQDTDPSCPDVVRQHGERLKDRVLSIVFPQLARSFLADRRERIGVSAEPTDADLAHVFDATLILLYRLLFLLYAEARDLLPMREATSLKQLAEEVTAVAGAAEAGASASARLENAYSPCETRLYDRLTACFGAADGGLFTRFLSEHKVPDCHLALALDRLARDQDEKTCARVFIDYRSLEVRLLGSIHEGLLECKLMVADNGEVFLASDKAQRKASGSFYTPDPLLEYIVAQTIDPVLDEKLEALRPEFRKPRMTACHVDLVERFFDLKVHDPAMGAGHFLVKAVDFITSRLLEFLQEFPASPVHVALDRTRASILRTLDEQGATVDPTWLTDRHLLREHVLKRCIYGVDIDPLAVELARVSLWLHACTVGAPLSFLNQHLRCGNSLVGASFPEVEVRGFDVVLGNPPYDVLAEKELKTDLTDLLGFFRQHPVFEPALGGKVNLYKLFICRGVELLRPGGRLGYIVPMALLGDQQAAGVRQFLLNRTALATVDAFPQKDDPKSRVFADAKLSTCVFITARTEAGCEFRVRVHPGRSIERDSPGLVIRPSAVTRYDPENQPIVACSQEDWDLAVKIMSGGRMRRLGEFCTAYQGEVNETTDGKKGNISTSPADGPLILRGANVCLYALRQASQGQAIYLRQARYLQGKRSSAKAYHFRQNRAAFQRNAPQNNFRRLIACFIPAGHFCCDTVSYFPESESRLPLPLLIALFNSKLLDWYFRLGSTNSKVNDYQVRNLPVPAFGLRAGNLAPLPGLEKWLARGRIEDVFRQVAPSLATPPFSAVVVDAILRVARRISRIEAERGDIGRSERSSLAAAQPYQDLLDRMLYRMAGLSDDEAAGLEARLARML
jgi:hypothetical protein